MAWKNVEKHAGPALYSCVRYRRARQRAEKDVYQMGEQALEQGFSKRLVRLICGDDQCA